MENQIFGKGRFDGSERRFFLNTEEVPGVESLNYNYSFNSISVPYLGGTKVPVVPNGEKIGSFSLSHRLISDDFFLPFTGNGGFNAYLLKSKKETSQNLTINSGYLNSYSCSCSIGEIPQININSDIYGDVGFSDFTYPTNFPESITNISTIQSSDTSYPLKIAHPGSIILNLNDLSNQTVDSFSLTINVPRNPIYKLGSTFPHKIEKAGLTEVNCSFIVKENDYIFKNIRNYPQNEYKNNLNIQFNDHNDDSNFLNYSFDNMRLFNQSYGVSPNNENVINLTYQGFYA
jgi:hypothetical protein